MRACVTPAPGTVTSGSTAFLQPDSQALRQSSGKDFFLRARNVIRHAVKGDDSGVDVIQQKSGPRIIVARLPDRARIHHVFCVLLISSLTVCLLFADL